MEEWFRANHISNQEKYARLATGLDTLKLDIFVPDFMNDPSKKSPYECLLIAILARFCLSKHLRARRETITWDTVFEYTPPVLKKRLQKTDNSYLKKHKVFIRCIGSTEVDEVGEDAAKGEPPIGHPSSTESDLHKAESRLNHETACENSPPDGQDTPKLTDQDMNQRKPEGDHKQSRRGNLKFTLLESCNFKPGRNSEERGSESDCTDMKMAEGTLGPEPCQEAGGTPSQETVRTENVLNSEAGSSSLTDLTTKKQEAESDEELSQCAAIGRFLAEALHLTPSKTSEERGKDVEMQELFEDGKTPKTAYETASQGSVAANSGPSSESIEIQKPEEEIGNLKPVYAHVTLQEECSLNSAVTSCDKWPVVEKNDMKMSNGKGDPERRSKASTAPCQESVTTKNGLNGKAGSSSLSTLDTEEENPHAEKKLPESTSLEGICSAALPLKKGERFSEKEAAESAKPPRPVSAVKLY
ncbi:hypothetical protein V5799_006198 [Amblyomma americanum]|uniref:Uncharacterized protein n=1 Tax=Amblyomma americanum TaxID=6943 RepID=A0AAQ4DX35_AMBAM